MRENTTFYPFIIISVVVVGIMLIPVGIHVSSKKEPSIPEIRAANPPISNDDIIKETLKCESAGLNAFLRYWDKTNDPAEVICYPKEKK